MKVLCQTLLLVTFSFVFHSFTVQAHSILPRADQAKQCSHPGGVNGINSACWDLLNMTAYTRKWWDDHKTECGPDSHFSTCFWQVHNMGMHDCTGVKPGACPTPDTNGFSAQDWYIAYNIFAINQVFSSLYMAIGNANTLASEAIGAIVALLNPPASQHVLLNDLMTALGAGVGVLPGGTPIKDFLVRILQQNPPIGKYIFPVGTTQSQFSQWATISNDIGTVVNWYQQNMSQVIPTVNNNVDNFILFASSGSFSVNPLPDLSNESQNLMKGLTTFVVSQALTTTNVIITQAPSTDVYELQKNSSDQLSFDPGCAKGYDGNGLCGPHWFESKTKTTYSIDNLQHMGKDYHDTLTTMFGNWTSGDLLFAGAKRCKDKGGVGSGGLATTTISSTGQVSLDCLSSVKICTWNMASLDTDKEFTDCPAQTGYVSNGCGGKNQCDSSNGAFEINVPVGYLGAYLTNPNFNDCVCNT